MPPGQSNSRGISHGDVADVGHGQDEDFDIAKE